MSFVFPETPNLPRGEADGIVGRLVSRFVSRFVAR